MKFLTYCHIAPFEKNIILYFPILFLIDTGEGRDRVSSPAHLRAAMLLKRLLPPRNVRPPMTAKILRVVNMFCEGKNVQFK